MIYELNNEELTVRFSTLGAEMVSLKKETEQLRNFKENMLLSLKDLFPGAFSHCGKAERK